MWRRVALDVERETVTAALKWETGSLELQGTALVKDGVLNRVRSYLNNSFPRIKYPILQFGICIIYCKYLSNICLCNYYSTLMQAVGSSGDNPLDKLTNRRSYPRQYTSGSGFC